MSTITSIKPQKRRPDRVNIDLDGEYALSLAGILAAALKVGQQLEPDEVAGLQSRDADETAFQQCLRLLGLRDRSEAELRSYLRKHKTPEDVAERTLLRLREHRHTDDDRFARAWIENRTAFRPRGRRALEWELSRKGVPAEVAAAALASLDESSLAHQAGIKKARQLQSTDWQQFRSKVSAYLARRGFPASIISSTVTNLWTETHAGQTSLQTEDIP